MTKIIELNGNYEFEFNGFSRNTNVQDGKLVSNAYVTLKDPTAAKIEELRGLALYTITSLRLLVDGSEIYALDGLTAKISSIDESVSEIGTLTCSLYISL